MLITITITITLQLTLQSRDLFQNGGICNFRQCLYRTEIFSGNVNFQLFLQFSIDEKLQLKVISQNALFLFFGNCNDYD